LGRNVPTFSRFMIGASLTAAFSVACVLAQPAATSGAIRCASCALAGQKPESFDPAKVSAVPRGEPVFMPGGVSGSGGPELTVRFEFIARVLGRSPLQLEMLDSRGQHVDRRMAVVLDDVHGGKDPGTCGVNLWDTIAVAADLRPLLRALRFNDLVTGTWLFQQNPQRPGSLLDGTPVITELRKATAPVAWFHSVPATPNCRNRSGRLVMYLDLAGGLLTIYNDGGIQYSTQHGQVFAQRGLSADELKELLAAFGEASIDTVPAAPAAARSSGSKLVLAAARYQVVFTDLPTTALAPVIGRLDLLKARAMASARLVLRTGAARAIQPGEAAGVQDLETAVRASEKTFGGRSIIRPDGTAGSDKVVLDRIPEFARVAGSKFLWPPSLGVRLADVPSDGATIPWSEIERHKLVYFGLRNAGYIGLTVIDGDRIYEKVRLCQVDYDGTIAALRSSALDDHSFCREPVDGSSRASQKG
jgi:hypothetical protein